MNKCPKLSVQGIISQFKKLFYLEGSNFYSAFVQSNSRYFIFSFSFPVSLLKVFSITWWNSALLFDIMTLSSRQCSVLEELVLTRTVCDTREDTSILNYILYNSQTRYLKEIIFRAVEFHL